MYVYTFIYILHISIRVYVYTVHVGIQTYSCPDVHVCLPVQISPKSAVRCAV